MGKKAKIKRAKAQKERQVREAADRTHAKDETDPQQKPDNSRDDSKAPSPEPPDPNTEDESESRPAELSKQESTTISKRDETQTSKPYEHTKTQLRAVAALGALAARALHTRLTLEALTDSADLEGTSHIELKIPFTDLFEEMRKGASKTQPKKLAHQQRSKKGKQKDDGVKETEVSMNDQEGSTANEGDKDAVARIIELLQLTEQEGPGNIKLQVKGQMIEAELSATPRDAQQSKDDDSAAVEVKPLKVKPKPRSKFHPEAANRTETPVEPIDDKPYILLIAMYSLDPHELTRISLYDKMFVSGYAIRRATATKQVLRCLRDPQHQPQAIILLDEALARDKKYARLACRVMEYVREGGTLICHNINDYGGPNGPSFSFRRKPEDGEPSEYFEERRRNTLPLFRLAGLPWEFGSTFYAHLTLNSRALFPISGDRGIMVPLTVVSTGILLDKVKNTDAWYLQVPESVCDALVYEGIGLLLDYPPKGSAEQHINGVAEGKNGGGTDMRDKERADSPAKSQSPAKGKAREESPTKAHSPAKGKARDERRVVGRATTEWTSVAYTQVGKGRFGWISDLDDQGQSDEIVLAMAGIDIPQDVIESVAKSESTKVFAIEQRTMENGAKAAGDGTNG